MPEKKGSSGEKTLYCSFCGKSQHEVRKLIAGPTVFICDECVELCMDIIREESKTALVKSRDGVPTPREICDVLDDYVIGQDHAMEMIAKRIQTSRAGLDNPSKPIGVFMLAGGASMYCVAVFAVSGVDSLNASGPVAPRKSALGG